MDDYLYRQKRGRIIAGVCSGLEISGYGPAIAWRVVFCISGYFVVGFFIYWGLATSLPEIDPIIEKEKLGRRTTDVDLIAEKIAKLALMLKNGDLTQSEHDDLRLRIINPPLKNQGK